MDTPVIKILIKKPGYPYTTQLHVKMKTSSLVLIALTLVSSFINASNEVEGSNKRKRVVKRQNRLDPQAIAIATSQAEEPVNSIPNHVLLELNAVAKPSNAPLTSTSVLKTLVDYDSSSLKSESDGEGEQTSNKKKRTEDDQVQSAVNALMTLSRSGGSSHVNIDDLIRGDEQEQEQKPARRRAAPKNRRTVTRRAAAPATTERKPLLALSEGAFTKATIKSFRSYFDDRNMATAGNETLMKCFFFSHFFDLAKYLVENGARLTENESLPAAFVAALAGDENSEIAAGILMELLKYDPLGTVKIFLNVAKTMETGTANAMDNFLMSLLMDKETSFLFFGSSSIPEIIEMLLDSELMPESLKYICNNYDGPVEKEMILEATVKVINSKNAALLEIFLENGWIDIDERMVLEKGKSQLTVASHLFGKFESQTILRLMQKFKYPLDYTHDRNTNPNGDILLAAAMGKDLASFKRLLLVGASYEVKMSPKMTLEKIVDLDRANRPGFYEAIQKFKAGELKAEVDAEDAANAPLNAINTEVVETTNDVVDEVDLTGDI